MRKYFMMSHTRLEAEIEAARKRYHELLDERHHRVERWHKEKKKELREHTGEK